jgi:branched-subunit amino acid transport protein
MMAAERAGREAPNKQKPFAVMVGESTSHCGSGCALGDICAEWLAFAFPAIAVALGWQSIFSEKIFAVWVLDYIFAFIFGIAFQYFTIAPMRNLAFVQGIWAAVKADTLSLTAWQVGMYGFMAIAFFWFFRRLIGTELKVDSFEFWFMMQIAMWFGFATGYPANWWLLHAGIKEKM